MDEEKKEASQESENTTLPFQEKHVQEVVEYLKKNSIIATELFAAHALALGIRAGEPETGGKTALREEVYQLAAELERLYDGFYGEKLAVNRITELCKKRHAFDAKQGILIEYLKANAPPLTPKELDSLLDFIQNPRYGTLCFVSPEGVPEETVDCATFFVDIEPTDFANKKELSKSVAEKLLPFFESVFKINSNTHLYFTPEEKENYSKNK